MKPLKTYLFFLLVFSCSIHFSQVSDSITSNLKYEKLDKNEISVMLTIDRNDYFLRFPQYGFGYARSISKKNKIWLFANHFRKDVLFSDYVRKTRLYEVGVEYRLKLSQKRPFYFTPSLAYMNTNWDYFNYYRDGSKIIINEKFHLANLTVGFLYGKTLKLGILRDLGFGLNDSCFRGYNKQNELTSESCGEGWTGAISKQLYINLSYQF